MSTMFSVSRLLGKGRKGSKRGPPSISSVSTEKEKERKSSLLAQPIDKSDEQGTVVTASNGQINENETTASERGSFSAPPPSSSVEVNPVIAESKNQTIDALPLAVAKSPSQAVVVPEKPNFSEEPGYATVQQAEERHSPTEWTEIHEDEGRDARDGNAAVAPTALVDKIETTSVPLDEENIAGNIVAREFNSSPEPVVQDTEGPLSATRRELEVITRAFDELQASMRSTKAAVESLEEEKDKIQERAKTEKQSLMEEVEHLKGTIDIERQESRERIGALENEINGLNSKLVEQQGYIDSLEEQLAQGREDTETLEAENAQLNSRLAEQQDCISHLEQRLAEEEEEAEGVDKRIRELETQVIRCEEDFEKAQNLVTEKENHIKMAEMNNNNLSSQISLLQTNLTTTERENRMVMDQLRRQSNELQTLKSSSSQCKPNVTRSIINGPRQARVENAITTIKLLNEEVFQTAAAITDQLEYIPKRFVTDDQGGSSMAEILKATLGLELVTKLTEEASYSSEAYNPFFLQMALQGSLIASCMRITTSWYPAEWEYANFLVVLYERIRGTGGPNIAMNWRKATQRCCFPSSDRNTRLVSTIIEQLMVVLTVCGWSKDSVAEQTLRTKFTQNLTDIVSQALRLNSLTTAESSGELEALITEPGQTFDDQRMVNECPFDADAERPQMPKFPPQNEVVCTSALGLKWVDVTGKESDHLLLKPKVVLNGALW